MRIKKWLIGIIVLLSMEVLPFLVFSMTFPEKTTAGNRGGVIQQSTVIWQEDDTAVKIRGEGNDSEDGEESDHLEKEENKGGEKASARKASKSNSKKQDGKRERAIYKKNKKELVLVDEDHAVEDSYDPSLRTICNGRLQASERIYSSLTKMLADAGEEGYHFWIASAYRSKEKQQKLVDEDVSRAMRKGLSYQDALEQTYQETMPAGHSEHQTGLALDLLCSGNMQMDVSQKEEPGNRWLQENCSHYGFILRYPEDKSNITGVSYEPWHFRYVGKSAAEYMQEEGITLEEFWDRMG